MISLRRRLKDIEDRLARERARESAQEEEAERIAWARLTEVERDALLRCGAKLEALGADPWDTALVASLTDEEAEAWLRLTIAREEASLWAGYTRTSESLDEAELRNPKQYGRWLTAFHAAVLLDTGDDPPSQTSESVSRTWRLAEAEESMLHKGYVPGQCCERCGWGHEDVDPENPCERCGGPVSENGYYHLRVQPLDKLRDNVEAIDSERHPEYHARLRSYLDRRVASAGGAD